MNKKRWAVLLGAVLLIAGGAIFIHNNLARRAEQKRQIDYRRITTEYSDALKRGTNRAEVETYIRSRGQSFQQMCCVGTRRDAWADLIKIGEENAPWYCSKNNVYVAFEFDAPEPRSTTKALDNDRLLSVTLYQRLEECL